MEVDWSLFLLSLNALDSAPTILRRATPWTDSGFSREIPPALSMILPLLLIRYKHP
jgi:hypothetical protein